VIKSFCILVISFLIAFPLFASLPEENISVSVSEPLKMHLSRIPAVVNEAVAKGEVPGAVIVIGNHEGVIYRSAFGSRAVTPEKLPMTPDTIFDLASLTKVTATTTAIMQLAENEKLDLNDPVVKYWPAFGANGKEKITIGHLLTHYSGLRADLSIKPKWGGYDRALKKIIAEKPKYPPGTHYIYSDINFEILGELVKRISGQRLDKYCEEHIFKPLGMKDTCFNPSRTLRSRIAPTEYKDTKRKTLLWGQVHDVIALRTGGVSGHAGLFSTADDLSVFARMLLNGGSFHGVQVLKSRTVEKMTSPQSPAGQVPLRGYGWNIDAPLAVNRGELPQAGLYYHTGYTGTAMWIDPVTETFIIVLTNRVHPDGRGNAEPLRKKIIELVSEAFEPLSKETIFAKRPRLSEYYNNPPLIPPLSKGGDRGVTPSSSNHNVQTGIDVLSAENYASLKGLRIGLITNHSGVDSSGRRTLDLLYNAKDITLSAVFSPEHGLNGTEDNKIASAAESVTGLPVYSLYGDALRPTPRMLDGLDALVFDIQDAGVRFYTYISTMGYAMEAAAKKGIAFYVLDRPNPVTASLVQGPVMEKDMKSFTGYFPLPVRHGMTVGELAEMFNAEYGIHADLHVIRMNGYKRAEWYDETGLRWINPSPNLRSLTEAVLYPGVAMAEGANVSVGRGTDKPFELLGAPWINAEKLSGYLNSRHIQGVKFFPLHFTPVSDHYKNKICNGVKITLTDRQTLDSAALGIEIISALHKLYPKDFHIGDTLGLIGSRKVLKEIRDGLDPKIIEVNWQGPLAQFQKQREKYLLYQ
jgi:uncharacterized protein YbbC (DUF1343 family)/CubicO group peptidase (beta-lactamase class C family)